MTKHLQLLVACVVLCAAAAPPAAAQHFSYLARHDQVLTLDGVPVTMVVTVLPLSRGETLAEEEIRRAVTSALELKGFSLEELDPRSFLRPSAAEQYWIPATLQLSFRRGGLVTGDGRHRCEEDRVRTQAGVIGPPVGRLEVRETRVTSQRIRTDDPTELADFIFDHVEALGAVVASHPHRRCRI
jgi:hypothetical protein